MKLAKYFAVLFLITEACSAFLNWGCEDNPCLHGGTCKQVYRQKLSRRKSFVCICPAAYSGRFCQEQSNGVFTKVIQSGKTECWRRPPWPPRYADYFDITAACRFNDGCLDQKGNAKLELPRASTHISFSRLGSRLIQGPGSSLVFRSANASKPQPAKILLRDTQLIQEENSNLTFEFMQWKPFVLELTLPRWILANAEANALIQVYTKGTSRGTTYLTIGANIMLEGSSKIIAEDGMILGTSKNSLLLIQSGTLKLTDPMAPPTNYVRMFEVRTLLVIEPGATLEILNVPCCVVKMMTSIAMGQHVFINSTGTFGGITCGPILEKKTDRNFGRPKKSKAFDREYYCDA